MQKKMTTAVLIPCLNEELTIEKVIKDWKEQLPHAEIYVYDNASLDKTVELAKKQGAIVRHEENRGKGNVLKRMFREIDADCYIMVDGDDTYSASNAAVMEKMILNNEADMVIGDRLATTYYVKNSRHFHSVGNQFVQFLLKVLYKSDAIDVLSGCRAMNRTFVKELYIETDGFEVETEITIYALKNQFCIRSIPTEYKERTNGSVSKLHTFRDGFRILRFIALSLIKNS